MLSHKTYTVDFFVKNPLTDEYDTDYIGITKTIMVSEEFLMGVVMRVDVLGCPDYTNIIRITQENGQVLDLTGFSLRDTGTTVGAVEQKGYNMMIDLGFGVQHIKRVSRDMLDGLNWCTSHLELNPGETEPFKLFLDGTQITSLEDHLKN